MSFVHLHTYSSYSLLNSTAKITDLVWRAKEKGFSALALTDYNVMYGTIAFYKECIKAKIKPIIGLTVEVQGCLNEERSYPLVLLAKNQNGYGNLLKISSAKQISPKQGLPLKWLRAYSRGIIGITPGIKGEIEQAILEGDLEGAIKCSRLFNEILDDGGFYYAFQNHGLKEETLIREKLAELSGQLHIPCVATNEIHYLEEEDAFAHECLLAIKNGNKLNDENREKLPNNQYYLKTAAEMEQLFPSSREAIENTVKIAEQCNVMISLNERNLPKYPVEEGSAEELLRRLCINGLYERYENPEEIHKKRLEYELSIINKMNFADYFLIVWDFMKFSRERGILTGPGRGSAAGSIVAYVLYITEVDPIKYNLLFERFLNPERISMPDIDIDFPDHRREEVIHYVSQKYGRQHVAQIITFGTLAAKAVLRDVGRVFGLSVSELDQLSRQIPGQLGITLKDAYGQSEGLRNFIQESPLRKKLFQTACKLEGLPRHTSIHAAGVVISEKPLVETVPIQRGHDDIFLTQYSMEYLEELGLLKMDFLGLRNLSLIENIVDSIFRHTKKKIDLKQLPLDDEETFRLLAKGETTGVFQLESDGMRDVLRRLKPTHFEDIVAVNALYRPGPMENIPLYINRKHGKDKVVYPHPDLEPILRNTYGVIVYQEQIMQIASKMAGFSLGEADLLRRAVSKKEKQTLDEERTHFVNGALNKGYDTKTANEIYDLIVKFANYGFNRSHAVAYSMIAYQLAYLKAHYPLYFMAALLTSAIGNEKKIAEYVRELKEMGFSILPPSINKSAYSFVPEQKGIRFSLAAIKGLGVAALKEIFQTRKSGPFRDLFDFCLRVSPRAVNRKVLEALVHSGSFDEFGKDRAILLASLDRAIEHARLIKPDGEKHGDLFSEDEAFLIKPKYAEVDPIPIQEKLHFEKEVLGFYLSDHPVSLYSRYFKALNISKLNAAPLHERIKIAVDIISVKKIRTKKGEAMAFLRINDESGDMEAIAFPDCYRKFMSLFEKGNIVFMEGKIEQRRGNKQFIIQYAAEMDKVIHDVCHREGTLYLKIEKETNTPMHHEKLKILLKNNPGKTKIVLYYAEEKRTVRYGEKDRVYPSEKFLDQLEGIFGKENVILK